MSSGVSDNSVPLPTMAQTRTRLRYLASFVRPHKREFVISVITAALMTLAATSVGLLMKQSMDRGILRNDSSELTLWAGVALIAVLLAALMQMLNHIFSVWSYRVLNDLRGSLFAHIQRQGLDFFHDMRTGTVISRLTNDIDALEQLVSDGVFMIFVNVLTLGAIEVFLFSMDWRLALATNIIFPIMLGATVAFRYYSARAYRRTRERMAMVTSFLAESLAGMRVVQAFAAEERMAADFDRTNTHYRKANMETIWLSAAYFPGVELLSAAGTAIVLWYGGFLSEQQLVTVGVLFAFIVYLNDFFDPIQQLSQFYGSFLSAMAALDKIMLVMETTPSIQDDPQALELPQLRGDVRFENVSFTYGGSDDAGNALPEVLHDVNLDVRAGETIALVGQTGAGKSTLVKLLTRFYDPTQGRVLLDGHDLRELRATWLRSSLGIVPQEGFLFSASIAENIRYGRPDASDEDVRAAAQAVGAHEFIEENDEGYEASVGERGNRLSAGQRQLIAFARAMLANPRLLVLDEATSSVDVATELRLADGLRRLVAGRTAFIVAHRLSTIRGADRIAVVDDGSIVELGSHDELIEAGGRYAALYGSWTAPEQTVEQCLTPDEMPAGT